MSTEKEKKDFPEKPKKKGKRGGPQPGAGRKPIEKRLSNYERAIKMLDDSIEDALKVLIDGLKDPEKSYRIRCAELLLKKAIPDKKDIKLSGDIILNFDKHDSNL